MKFLCNGYADRDAGSVSTASYLVIEELLRRGHHIRFFGKPSFVFPVELHERFANFELVDVTNVKTETLDNCLRPRIGPGKLITGALNHWGFLRRVTAAMDDAARRDRFDAAMFLGLVPPRRVEGVRTIAWAQGPAGTDADSIERHRILLQETEGCFRTLALDLYGRFKTSFLEPSRYSLDHVIVGSNWSRIRMETLDIVRPGLCTALPYPINPLRFTVRPFPESSSLRKLKVLWLGRVVPRKRLDLFLKGIEVAVGRGLEIDATIVGDFGFSPGLRKLLEQSSSRPYVTHRPSIPQREVVELIHTTDVLCQPSENEDFGSSVAEAQMCGTPVIVGHTNGTGDYVCPKSIRLADDSPETLANAFKLMWERKQRGELIDVAMTRSHAETQFDVRRIVDRLEKICLGVN